MRLAISIIILIVIMAFIGHLSVTFKPFSISLPYWDRALGALLIGIGLIMLGRADYRSGYDKGVNDTIKEVKEYVQKISKGE